MKKLLFILLVSLGMIIRAQDLVILHTNDMHSHLNGFSPEAEYTPLIKDNDPTRGGFARIAGYIAAEKEKTGDHILVVDGGDFLMGTLFQTLELKEGFQLNLMKKMGYDFVTLGNHEFDYGPDMLAKIINNNLRNGDIPQILSTNYGGSTIAPDQELQLLYENGTILSYAVTEKNGITIGLFGLMGIDADESIASYYGLKFQDQKKVAKTTARYLKQVEKVDLVIALSHSGVSKNKKDEWSGEDIEYAKAAPDIDLIISGHTHSYLPELIQAGNAVIVQTGSSGLNVGRIELHLNKGQKPGIAYQLIPMNDAVTADANVQAMIDEKIPVIETHVLQHIQVKMNEPLFETAFDLVMDEDKPFESNLGPFLADAIHYDLNRPEGPKVDMALVATGVIRNNVVKGNKGFQNISDIFNVMPLGLGKEDLPGSPLGKIYITGNELKKVLELILAVSPSKKNYYLYYSGTQIEYNPEKGLFKKISAIKIGDLQNGFNELDISKRSTQLLSIAANEYMISFIGQLKKMSFGIVKVVPKDVDGFPVDASQFVIDLDVEKEGVQEAKEWLSIYNYVKSFEDVNGNQVPDVPEHYRSKKNPLILVK
ncbi:MAG: bifunctional metallophosphatase/5'-nucleotidase [Prolixibacteraceae bacterium]|nr:bifunctional metallophosphatase/5'-nucleotidase [Prolixibacteraceae bacterium]